MTEAQWIAKHTQLGCTCDFPDKWRCKGTRPPGQLDCDCRCHVYEAQAPVASAKHARQLIKGVDHVGIAVSFFCHDGNGNALLGKRGPGSLVEIDKWDIGAGSVDHGISVVDTIHKEIKEEYSAEVKHIQLLGFRDIFTETTEGKMHWVTIDHVVQIGTEFANLELDEQRRPVLNDLKWFPINQLPPLTEMYSQFSRWLLLYAQLIGKYIDHKPACVWVDKHKAK